MRIPLTLIEPFLSPSRCPSIQPWRACVFALFVLGISLFSLPSVSSAQEQSQSSEEQQRQQQTEKTEPAVVKDEPKAIKETKEKKDGGTFQPSEEISEDFAVSFPTDI